MLFPSVGVYILKNTKEIIKNLIFFSIIPAKEIRPSGKF